ncbi:transcriptional regulator AraC family [Thermacetogenium phaeum DSM 12270]|jgi:ribosomal protein S27E|uniref:Transcriptional regulator AraC family n=2 Tax=Thermacetogenium phaeum TaxID=85874 RepID=K4LIH8_THEPS|nr:CD1247 N-terminal domain-containing protein [Thermacetogenium phaeum]MDK2881445.1 hypothetical protein [Clostridia bacterium]MDN5365584.1 hypothetical protein [Thermacetogenium sp.]AFV11852.1 transcriptional regulator AraC family [Thermacetogenium phaeum DSM 12270]KUK35902.1 MAG: Transcriptional regulator AraC family [Thermacetogenium phaeum]MDN5376141.1 hypothetical protein [Thermacetogenium sp.]
MVDDLREKIAYLQGLAEGLKLEEGSDEAKIIKQIIDVLADLTDEVEELQVAVEDLEDYLDEELFVEEEEDEEECEGDEFEDEDDDVYDNADDIDYVEVECPQCHDIICFESDIVDDEDVIEVTCPNCNKVVYVNDGSMPLPKGWKKKEEDREQEDL